MQIPSEGELGSQESLALYTFLHKDNNAIEAEGCQHISHIQWNLRLELLCLRTLPSLWQNSFYQSIIFMLSLGRQQPHRS